MADYTGVSGSPPVLVHPSTFAPVASADFPVGTPICIIGSGDDTGKAAPTFAGAESVARLYCVGLARSQGLTGERLIAQYNDVLKLAAFEWDAVTGQSGGLSPGFPYYLSGATAGKLVVTAPVSEGTFVEPIGIALSATEMLIQITFPLLGAV